MGAVWMRARAELRARWRALVGLALLVSLIGGGALAAASGARRTMSAYPRFLERYRAADASVGTGRHPETDRIFEAIAALPSVESVARRAIFIGRARTETGHEVEFPDVFFVAPLAREARSMQPKMLDGRAPDPDADDELMANYYMAERLGVGAGDRVQITVQTPPWEPQPGREATGSYLVTGVYAATGEFESLTESGFPTTLTFPPAFARRYGRFHDGREDTLEIRLRGGPAGFADLVRDMERTTVEIDGREHPLSDLTDGPPKPTSDFTEPVQALDRMPAVTLALLAAFLALAVAVVTGQSLGRESALWIVDVAALRALGMSPPARAGADLVRTAAVAFAGAAGAVAIAIALSSLTPIGVAHVAEPTPGFAVDLFALGFGALSLVVIVMLAGVPAALRSGRRGVEGSQRLSVTAEILFRVGAPPSTVTGVGLALNSARGRFRVPVRTTVLGVSVAVAVLVAALAFRASMDRLRTDPVLSGFRYDTVVLPAFTGEIDPTLIEGFVRTLRARPAVDAVWRGSFFGAGVRVQGIDLTSTSYEGVEPVIVSGRSPSTADQVALDARTMRILGVRIGGTVEIGTPEFAETPVASRPMHIVGRFIPPRLPFIGAGSGQGAALTKEGMESFGGAWDAVFARFLPGIDPEEEITRLRHALRGPELFAVVSRAQSTSARNVAGIARIPVILAACLGLLGAATLIHTMLLTVRRRRRDLAVLKTLGLVGRQIRAAVAWQATSLVVLALIAGVPAGVASGRWAWRAFADQIEVFPLPVVPVLLAPAAIVVTLIAGNAIAAFPARAAARTKPALVLRSE